MKLKEIQELVEWLIAKEITEFEMRQRGTKIRIRRGTLLEGPEGVSSPTQASSPSAPQPAQPSTDPPAPEAGISQVTSPIVGTFYRRPNPKADPYVEVGDTVTKGQTLCIVEAMKVMNEIDATESGVITAIHVDDTAPVEYGEALYSIKTA